MAAKWKLVETPYKPLTTAIGAGAPNGVRKVTAERCRRRQRLAAHLPPGGPVCLRCTWADGRASTTAPARPPRHGPPARRGPRSGGARVGAARDRSVPGRHRRVDSSAGAVHRHGRGRSRAGPRPARVGTGTHRLACGQAGTTTITIDHTAATASTTDSGPSPEGRGGLDRPGTRRRRCRETRRMSPRPARALAGSAARSARARDRRAG